MLKKDLTERETCTQYIYPNLMMKNKVNKETFEHLMQAVLRETFEG